jgi:hydroxyacylglutathione hydrolase
MMDDGREAIVVDPGDAAPVLEALKMRRLLLRGILVTHHHADHVGGIAYLRPELLGPVWGPGRERIPPPFTNVADEDLITALGVTWQVLEVPGHTAGHVAYFAPDFPEGPLLCCGDTLFSGGCGRLFEGTAAQMHHSLRRLAALPAHTRVCCAHEYTLSNLRFAEAAEPGNADILAHRQWCETQRARGEPTLPSTLALELRINPFLRCDHPEVTAQALAQGAPDTAPVSIFAGLREWKNRFR